MTPSLSAAPQGAYGLPVGPVLQRAPQSTTRPGRPWLITIVDLITLLLTFFVLLFSMSKVEPQRFTEVVQSYGGAFAPAPDDKSRVPAIKAAAGDDLNYLQAVLKAAFASSPALKDVEFRLTPQYLMLTLPVESLFAPELDKSLAGGFAAGAETSVFDLGGVLSNLKNRIAVIGTAAGAKDEASWSLAIARAQATANALAAAGYDQPVTVLGRASAATDVAAAIGRVQIMIMPEMVTSKQVTP